jgi:hypothetical protein
VDTLLKRADLGGTDHRIVRADGFLRALGHAPSPVEQQAGRNTMPTGDEGNRHARHGGFFQDLQFLVN